MSAPATQLLNGRDMRVLFSAPIGNDLYVVVTPSPVRPGELRVSVTNGAGTREGNGRYVSTTDDVEQAMYRLWSGSAFRTAAQFKVTEHGS